MTAAQTQAGEGQTPISFAMDFLRGVAPGALCSTASVVSKTKSTTFVNVRSAQGEDLCANASVILSKRRVTDTIASAQMPAAPPPDQVAEATFSHPIATWISQYEQRFVVGEILTRNPRMRSLSWARPKPAAPWTWVNLAAFADANFPRIFLHYETLTAIATVTMSIHFHCTQPELDALGNELLLVEAFCDAANAGVYDQTVKVWSRAGQLVMSSTQIAVFSVLTETA